MGINGAGQGHHGRTAGVDSGDNICMSGPISTVRGPLFGTSSTVTAIGNSATYQVSSGN